MPSTKTKSIIASNKIKLIVKPKNLEVIGFSKPARKLFTTSQLAPKRIYITDLFLSKKIITEFEKLQKSSKLKQIKIESIKIKQKSKVENTFSLEAKIFNSGKEKLIECTFAENQSKLKRNNLTSQIKHPDNEELQKTNKKIREMVDASPYGVHVYKLNWNDELIFSGYNASADRILGINHSHLLNKKIEEAFPQLINTEIPLIYKSIARNGNRFENEIVNYNDNLIRGFFDVSAIQIEPGKITAFFSDITEKRKFTMSLKKVN